MEALLEKKYKDILAQVRHPNQRSWILFGGASAYGDMALLCSLAQAFVKTHGHAITIVLAPDQVPLVQMYPHRFLAAHTAERHVMLDMVHHYVDPLAFDLDMPICTHSFDIGDGRGDGLMYLYKYPGRGGLNLTDLYRYFLRLPWDARIERPIVPAEWNAEAAQIAQQIGMPKGESVILFPSNNSEHPQFPDIFWETVAARLTRRGLKVFTNMKSGKFQPKTMPIAGTTPIDVPRHLAIPLVDYTGRTVCSTNGMQFSIMLGARFKQMNVVMPISKNFTVHMQNGRPYDQTGFMAQYMYPELVCDVPFEEFSVPHDGTDQELIDVAIAIADDAFDHPNCVKRLGESGRPYIEEQGGWLRELIEPPPAIQ